MIRWGISVERMETVRSSQMEMLSIKATVTEMRNDFDKVISTLDTVNLKTDRSTQTT